MGVHSLMTPKAGMPGMGTALSAQVPEQRQWGVTKTEEMSVGRGRHGRVCLEAAGAGGCSFPERKPPNPADPGPLRGRGPSSSSGSRFREVLGAGETGGRDPRPLRIPMKRHYLGHSREPGSSCQGPGQAQGPSRVSTVMGPVTLAARS